MGKNFEGKELCMMMINWRTGQAGPNKKWRNATKQWLETMNLCIYAKENSCPLHPLITFCFTSWWCLWFSIITAYYVILAYFVWACLPRPPIDHHRRGLALVLRIMIDEIWLLPEAQRSCFWCLLLDTCLWMTMPALHPRHFAPIYRFLERSRDQN